jgi:hypothetical protein
MAVGQNALHAGLSYLAVGRETTLGTYDTCTSQLEFLSASLKTTKERKILEEIARDRTYAKDLGLMKVVEGDVEHYFKPDQTASAYILQNAFGGTVTTATATGETAGGAALSHTFAIGSMNQSYPSLCLNMRKGPSSSGRVFQYSGARVNEYTFSAELEEPLKVSQSFICMDSTQVSNDVSSALSHSASTPCLSFTNGRFSVESTFGSLTSTSFWHVESFEFKISNSLKSDDSRRIGSDILQDLPPGMAAFELSATIRFDTTTAYDAMLAETELAAEFEFLGDTLGTSIIRRGINLQFPKVTISEAGDPEIGGPDEVLKSDVTFMVLRDIGQSFACQAILTNAVSSYA